MGRRTLLVIASILVAATGTALLWLYVRSADDRARSGWQTRQVLVATADIPAGSGVEAVRQRVSLTSVPAQLVPAGALTSLEQVTGRITTTPVLSGQYLVGAQFAVTGQAAGIQNGRMAVSVTVADPNRSAGLLRPGSRISVFFLDPDGARAKPSNGSVRPLLPDVRVLVVGDRSTLYTPAGANDRVGSQSGVPAAVVALEVTGKQAATLIMAQAKGQLWFTVLGDGSSVQDSDRATGNELPVGA